MEELKWEVSVSVVESENWFWAALFTGESSLPAVPMTKEVNYLYLSHLQAKFFCQSFKCLTFILHN